MKVRSNLTQRKTDKPENEKKSIKHLKKKKKIGVLMEKVKGNSYNLKTQNKMGSQHCIICFNKYP